MRRYLALLLSLFLLTFLIGYSVNSSVSQNQNKEQTKVTIKEQGFSKPIKDTEISTLLTMTKDEIMKELGPNFEEVGTGAEGACTGYFFKDYDITITFDADIGIDTGSNSGYIAWIDCGDNVSIKGVKSGSSFKQIQEKLGQGKLEDGWEETPDHKTWSLYYTVYDYNVEFRAFDKEGSETWISIEKCYSNNLDQNTDVVANKPIDDKLQESKMIIVNEENAKNLNQENGNSVFYLGMSKEEAIAELDRLKMKIVDEHEGLNDNYEPNGIIFIITENFEFVFNPDNNLYDISVEKDIATNRGLKQGDSIEKMYDLYGKEDSFDQGWQMYVYKMQDYNFGVVVKDGIVDYWRLYEE